MGDTTMLQSEFYERTKVTVDGDELDVHFDMNTYPKNPQGYLFTSYRVSSHEYYRNGKIERVRVKSYSFKAGK